MNILIADSGSTKTEWILVNEKGEKKDFYSEGMNPYFMSKEDMKKNIAAHVADPLAGEEVDKIFFYGSGCGSPKGKETVEQAISAHFPNAKICVETDLLAAAKACFMNSPGLACILGTGSNSCLYDGTKITHKIPSLGFTLGDEGSGGYFGKKIIRSYFYNIMPKDLRKVLEQRHDMNLDHILENVYKKPNANRFVASFSQLLGDHADHPFIREIVKKGFEDFADKQLAYFSGIKGANVGFVGSIAAVHKETLEQVLNERELNLSIIVRKPIERLVEYHVKKYSE
ncbi:hypothetical protein [Gracilimonas tropica]|uniref:hypothetical protein n=1 Tax=Gracilimonas tropica TaxID=454600 RepID=UPI00037FA9F0|nr:hypothetical protein [Gracilimonas tropica]